jgi:two-component system, sensor histidine kinase
VRIANFWQGRSARVSAAAAFARTDAPDATAAPDARRARGDARVAEALERNALTGDRWAAVTMIAGAVFLAAVVDQHGAVPTAWAWCGACVTLALVRLALIRARGLRAPPLPAPPDGRLWLGLLFAASAAWGAGPPLFILSTPTHDTLFTGIMLVVAALSALMVAASRPAVYLTLFPALGPLLAMLALRPAGPAGYAHSLLLAALAATLLVVLVRLTLDQNDSLALLLAARFRNEDLVQQLRSQIDVAARANEEKTRFLASAAHDLRQPLHALGMFCAALEQRLLESPEKPLVRNMMKAIEALDSSFGTMLDISRLDAGVVQKSPQTFAIRDVFRRLYQQFGGDAEARGLALRFHAAGRIVHTDPQLLERVLANLVQNALRYTREGGVLVAARRHPRGIALEVWDTGVGIPEDKRELIFREFYQIDNPERDRGRGLGMGLAIVQRLCRLLEHPLEVHSTVDRGSVFRLLVPAGEASAIDAPTVETETLPPRKLGALTVLLIDDELAIREATRELLRPMHVGVIAAGTIAEGVELAGQSPDGVDLIISDWRLRGSENGVDAVRAVRAVCGGATPAVLITGDTSADLLKLAHESGLVVLHKPLQPRHLVRLVKHLRR